MDQEQRPGLSGAAGVPGTAKPAAGPVSERMQALLSRALEDQLGEQRAVSVVLGDLRAEVAGIAEGLRSAASADGLDRLGGELAAQAAELRRGADQLAERVDVLSRRLEEVAQTAAAGGAGSEALALRVSALSADVAAAASATAELSSAVRSFPGALAALQQDLAGLHDRMAPLSELRDEVAELATRPTGEALRPEVEGLREVVAGLPASGDLDRVRDAVVELVGPRLDRLEQLAARPAVDPAGLDSTLAGLSTAVGLLPERLAPVEERLTLLDGRLDQVAQGLSAAGESTAGLPAVASDVTRLAARVDELAAVRDELRVVRGELAALREEVAVPTVPLAIAGVRQDIDELGGRLDALDLPAPEQVAAAVAPRVADQLVDRLAPRVAELVLARVAPALVEQVTRSTSGAVLSGVAELVHSSTADSERRVLAHVDEAVLALAEALLRRRRSARGDAGLLGLAAPAAVEPSPAAATAPVDLSSTPSDLPAAPADLPAAPAELAFPDIAAPDLDGEDGSAATAEPAGPVDEDGQELPVAGTGDIASVAGEPALTGDEAETVGAAGPGTPDEALDEALDEAGTADVAGAAQDVDGDARDVDGDAQDVPGDAPQGDAATGPQEGEPDHVPAGDVQQAAAVSAAPDEPESAPVEPGTAPVELAPDVALEEPVSPTATTEHEAVRAREPAEHAADDSDDGDEPDGGDEPGTPPYARVAPAVRPARPPQRGGAERPAVPGALAPAPERARPVAPPVPPAAPGTAPPQDEEDGRRRPWWRPGG